jgi:hypothetical protein
MKTANSDIAVATADERAPGMPRLRSADAASQATPDITDGRRLNLARASPARSAASHARARRR